MILIDPLAESLLIADSLTICLARRFPSDCMVMIMLALGLPALDAPQMTLLFLTTVAALTTVLVIMFRELERSPQAQRIRSTLARLIERDRFGRSRSSHINRDYQDR